MEFAGFWIRDSILVLFFLIFCADAGYLFRVSVSLSMYEGVAFLGGFCVVGHLSRCDCGS